MYKATFANNEIYDCSLFAICPEYNCLWLCINNITFSEAFNLFQNTEAMASVYYSGDDETAYGYTNMQMIEKDGTGFKAKFTKSEANNG